MSKRYHVGGTTISALEAVNLHVDETGFVVTVGPSSCGKTTLVNVIGALNTPSGSIRINGRDISSALRAERFDIRRHEGRLEETKSTRAPCTFQVSNCQS